jgi:excisionase family DNA binding protein
MTNNMNNTATHLSHRNNTKAVPIADKALLTLEEAAVYFNIGSQKLRELTGDDHCPFVLWNGSKRLIKREPFKEYLYKQYSI